MTYPPDWPTCVWCERPALDGHLTCGRATCSESGARQMMGMREPTDADYARARELFDQQVATGEWFLKEDPRGYEIARDVCHRMGLPWTDPRTGVSYPPPAGWILNVWVVYDHPLDQPDYYVVRRQWADKDGVIQKDRRSYGFVTLERARGWLQQMGLTCLARAPEDDPVIVETWL